MGGGRRVLLVEDDPAQRFLLAAYLSQSGFQVLEAGSVGEAWLHIREGSPDLVLLDLNLPDGDGLDLARELRAKDLPVIVVSLREEDRLVGLEIGVDDFVTKPYQPRELVARASNVLRRCHGRPAGEARCFGPYRIHGERRVVLDEDGQEVTLTRGEFDLLNDLFQARGRVRSRGQLAEVLSPDGDYASGRSVDVLVSRLRQKLEVDPRSPSLLLTAPGYGYRLNA